MAGSSRSKKSTATKAPAKAPARKRAPGVTQFGPRRFRLKARTGALELVGPDGSVWAPVACGEHRSSELVERASDEAPSGPKGFQPGCEACTEQAETTAAHALSNSTV